MRATTVQRGGTTFAAIAVATLSVTLGGCRKESTNCNRNPILECGDFRPDDPTSTGTTTSTSSTTATTTSTGSSSTATSSSGGASSSGTGGAGGGAGGGGGAP